MLRIETTIRHLQVGDVINGPFTDGRETVTRIPEETEPGFWTWETDKHGGENHWTSSGPESQVFVEFSTARDVAARIVDALDRFPPDVRLEVLRFFCGVCGERNCGQHR